MDAKQPDLKSLLGRARKDKHSPLYRAMRENYDAMVRTFQKQPPNWASLAAGFAELGIFDGTGKPPTLRGAQETWYRVKRDQAKQQRRPPVKHEPVSETVIAKAPAILPPDDQAVREEAPRPKPRIEFKPAFSRPPSNKDS